MKKIAHLLMGRLTIVGVSILLQICWLFLVLWKFSYQFTYANLIIRAAAIVLVLVIANKWENRRINFPGRSDSVVADPWNHAVFPVWTLRSDEAHQRTDGWP